MKTILLYISTILNALLIIAIFFKSSLNDIVVEYFKDKIDMRKKRRDAINLAYSIAKKLRTTTFIVLVDHARGPSTSPTPASLKKDYLEEFGKFNAEIESVELFLPQKAIEAYSKFRNMVKGYGSEISREGTTQERLIEIGKSLEIQIDILKKELSKGFK